MYLFVLHCFSFLTVENFLARKFKLLNTDNLWINLKGVKKAPAFLFFHFSVDITKPAALKRVLQADDMHLDIISKTKILEDGRTILQVNTKTNIVHSCD